MTQNTGRPRTSGNPLFPGWYADPELHFSEGQYTSSSGHHSVLKLLGTDDDWVICYHRRPLGEIFAGHRVSCLERLDFLDGGSIAPVRLTHEGVKAHPGSET